MAINDFKVEKIMEFLYYRAKDPLSDVVPLTNTIPTRK